VRRENNFDVIRLVLAWIVVITHCYDLSASPALAVLQPIMQSRRAVEGFFAISGCLIVASWDRTRSTRDYIKKRANRILPAYWLALAMCLAIGSVMTTLPQSVFWKNIQTWKYLFWNLLFMNFMHPGLPGVFEHNPANSAMDGALWTIKLEVAFYILVPFMVWAVRRFGRLWTLGTIFAASAAYHLILLDLGHEKLSLQLPGQLCFFMVGAAVYYYYAEFNAHWRLIWAVTLPLLLVALLTNWFILDAIAVPLFTMAVAFLLPPHRGITHYGDFSYGTYVLHYPVVQTVVALGLFATSPWLAFSVVIVTVMVLAVTSWFTVERRFLSPARVRQQESEARGQVAV
jgi:peptidoglycan/LPS O-acetylase OafA/YrhL